MEKMNSVYEMCTGTVGVLTFFRDNVADLGWEVWDDQISSNNYIVIRSNGHSKNSGGVFCYIKIFIYNITSINIIAHTWWDNTNQTGWHPQCYAVGGSVSNTGFYHDDAGDNGITIKGNKDILCISCRRQSNNAIDSSIIFRIDSPTYPHRVVSQETCTHGTNVPMQLGVGDIAQVKLNTPYRLQSPEGHIDRVQFTNFDIENNIATIDNLTYTCLSGTCIGGAVAAPWMTFGPADVGGEIFYIPITIGSSYTNLAYKYLCNFTQGINGYYFTDYYNHGENSIQPFLFYGSNVGSVGSCSYLQWVQLGAMGDSEAIGINSVEVGQVTTPSSSSLIDSSKNWEVDTFKGYSVVITSGELEESTRYITSNTSTTINVDPDFGTTVSGGVTFTICEAFFRSMDDLSNSTTAFWNYALIKDV